MHPDHEVQMMQLLAEISHTLIRAVAVLEELRDVVRTLNFEEYDDQPAEEVSH